MRNIILLAFIAGVLTGCYTTTPASDAEYAATLNADPRVWPPMVPGTAFPDQIMDGKN